MPLYSDLPQFEPFRQTRAVQLGPAADPSKGHRGPKSGRISAAIVSLGQGYGHCTGRHKGEQPFFQWRTSHNFPPSLTVKDEPISQTAVFCTGFHYHHGAPKMVYIYIYMLCLFVNIEFCINNKILFVKSNNFVSERQNVLPFPLFRTPVCPLCFGCAILFVNPHGRVCEPMPPMNLLIKPRVGGCNMACRYCFYRDETENRETGFYGIMNTETSGTSDQRTFEFATGRVTFAFQGVSEPTLAGLPFFEAFIERVEKWNSSV